MDNLATLGSFFKLRAGLVYRIVSSFPPVNVHADLKISLGLKVSITRFRMEISIPTIIARQNLDLLYSVKPSYCTSLSNMIKLFLSTLAIGAVCPTVSAHGFLQTITANGVDYPGWAVFSDPFVTPTPTRYTRRYTDNGPVVGKATSLSYTRAEI